MLMSEKGYSYLVRVAGTDIRGEMPVMFALGKIPGISPRLGFAIAKAAGIDPMERLGILPETTIKKIEEIIANPIEHGIPAWLLNRRKDYNTGEDIHLISSDLKLQIKNDIERLIKIRSYRGIRHSLGLKVRGQRTRTTKRGKGTVGVVRRKR